MDQELARRREEALQVIPEGSIGDGVKPFEVVIAHNIQYPYRFSQEYWWLEVLSSDMSSACKIARDWIGQLKRENFEYTDWVRPSTPHQKELKVDNKYLQVFWNIPTPKNPERGVAVRNPVDGRRVGFVVSEARKKQSLSSSNLDDFTLLSKRPNESSDLVALVPLVWEM